MLSKELDRQDFEAWFVPRFHPRHMHRNKMGNYYFMDAEIAWTAWKARSAELLSLREQLAELTQRPTEQEFNKACSEGRKYRERAETAERKLAVLQGGDNG